MADGPGLVDWGLAERIAIRVAGREPFAGSYHADSLGPDFAELTAEAEALVVAETGLVSAHGPARARVTDRPGWIRANVASFQRLLRPVTDKLADRVGASGPLTSFTRAAAGAEVGALLGWMSTRVLGQYDLLIIEDERPEDQDLVYYVGPNVLGLEKRFAFPPREFRLWLALHEVTHRAQFTGVPWLRQHFLGLVSSTLESVEPDPGRLFEAAGRVSTAVRQGRNPLADGGLARLLASPEQAEVLDQVAGMMSLLEGHGDVTMDRAGADRIANADRFSRTLRARRNATKPLLRVLQQLIGLEAKLHQYEQGERFIEAVEVHGGKELLEVAFAAPANLPTLQEIKAPDQWLARIQVA
jgi:coenzyme F420 biosynthesis associated uncharacterized protein